MDLSKMSRLERFHAIMDQGGDAIFVVDIKTGRIIDLNETACRMLGYSREELLKLTPADIDETYPFKTREYRAKFAKEMTESGKSVISSNGIMRRKDGSTFPMEISISAKDFHGETYLLGIVRDITERRQIEEQMRQAEERYRVLYENIPSMYFTVDPKGTVISVNGFGASQLGYTVKELLGQSVLKVFLEEDWPAVIEQLNTCIESPSRVHDWQIRKIRKDGSLLWVEEFARMIEGPDGAPNILIVCQDISRRKLAEDALQEAKENLEQRVEERTSELVNANISLQREISERKRAEEQLKKERDRAQQYLDVAGAVFVVINADQEVKLINKKGCEILEYTEPEIAGKNWFDHFVPERYRTEVRAGFEKLLAGEVKLLEYFENPVLTKSGEEKIIAWHNTVLRDDNNRVIGTLSSGQNITERKKTEMALRESEERYELAVEAGKVGIWDWNILTNDIYVAPNLKQLIGYKDSEIKNHLGSWLKKIHVYDRDMVMEAFENLVRGRVPYYESEHRKIHKDGSIRWFIARANAVRDSSGKVVRITGSDSDITVRKLMEVELKKHRDHLEELVGERTVRLKTMNEKLRKEVRERRRTEKELKQSREQLRKLSAHLESTREKERARIAREIHDELGQSLSTLQMDLAWLELNLEHGKKAVLEKIRSMSIFSSNIIKEVQRISQELRSSVLDHLGFIAALSWQTQEFQKKTGIRCDFLCKSKDIELQEEQSNALYRVSQESLTNIYRHANASRVSVILEEKKREIRLTIRDDGVGIAKERINDPDSLGLIGIRERLYFLKGKLNIKGIPGKGTTSIVTIPLGIKGEKIDESSNRR